ncbi:SAM-dependent methyltransferase [Rhizobium sp. YIM 134829]|uniref:SAM-dependent methyltransferase n=1 Tax=Rhizobium sp. YIM 134829 TaxID=3390453 RepID=UPI003978A90A
MASFQDELGTLLRGVDAIAALGAALKLHALGADPHPDVPLRTALQHLVPSGVEEVDPKTAGFLSKLIIARLAEAQDFLAKPDRGPGWSQVVSPLMHAMGEASRMVPHHMHALAATRPGLAAALRGRMLDVGTGIGALALEALSLEPTLQVVGLDIWPEALAEAEARRRESPYGDRLELRNEDVTALTETSAYTLAWLPTPFMPRPVAEAALDRLVVSLQPNGWLVTVTFAIPADPAGAAIGRLRLLRAGGYPWTAEELSGALQARGLQEVEAIPLGPTIMFIGRR